VDNVLNESILNLIKKPNPESSSSTRPRRLQKPPSDYALTVKTRA
jgi:hypothetical protein